MWLDTLPLARQLLPSLTSHSQAALQRALDIPAAALQHRAEADVDMLEQVVTRLAGQQDLTYFMQLPGSHIGSFGQSQELQKK